jgi:hypothetical protein
MKQLMENWRKYAKKDAELENLEEGLESPLVQDAAKWMKDLPSGDAQRLVGLLKAFNETDQVPDGLEDLLRGTPYDLNLNEAFIAADDVKKNLQILILGAALFAAGTTVVGNIGQAIDQTVSTVGQSIGAAVQSVDSSIEGFSDQRD